ncbi:MAG TPA: carboxypeptidase-like regulatory domain-containing protein, partial [Saprospiraceae bacterium]|nr:carboxypeptidase-like regulatory domain-containing protein [Saprospiraceae bacterium]
MYRNHFHPALCRLSWPFFLLLFSVMAATGQRTITGKVTDAQTGEGIIGANIVVEGSTTGTVSDFDGSYTLNVP